MKSIKLFVMLCLALVSSVAVSQEIKPVKCEDSLKYYADNWFYKHQISSLLLLEEHYYENFARIWYGAKPELDQDRLFDSEYISENLNEEQMNLIEDELVNVLKVMNSRICFYQHVYADPIALIEKQKYHSEATKKLLIDMKKKHEEFQTFIAPTQDNIQYFYDGLKNMESARTSKYQSAKKRFNDEEFLIVKENPFSEEDRLAIIDTLINIFNEMYNARSNAHEEMYVWAIILDRNINAAGNGVDKDSKELSSVMERANRFIEFFAREYINK